MLVLITGKARHGKDTLAALCAAELAKQDVTSEIMHYADALKEEARYAGWNGAKDATGRTLLQNLGARRRAEDSEYWVRKLAKRAGDSAANAVLVPDTRYQNEHNTEGALGASGRKAFVVRIVRVNEDGTEYDNGLTDAQKGHVSETDLDHIYLYTLVVKSGVDNVKRAAESLAAALINKTGVGSVCTYAGALEESTNG